MGLSLEAGCAGAGRTPATRPQSPGDTFGPMTDDSTHDLGYAATNARLPAGVELAYDGLVLDVGVDVE